MRVLVLTSTCLRHKSFANIVIKKCRALGYEVMCIFESKDYNSMNNEYKELCFYKDTTSAIDNHCLASCDEGSINSKKIVDAIKDYDPDIGLVFGTSILKERVFGAPKAGCYNVHTGLVQHYRGVENVTWPLVQKEYDKIGFTVHKVSPGIDNGKVILQRKISPKYFYDPYRMFLHVCKAGTETLVENLEKICKNEIETLDIKPSGKLYRKKDSFENMETIARQNLYEFNTRH